MLSQPHVPGTMVYGLRDRLVREQARDSHSRVLPISASPVPVPWHYC